MSLTLGSIVIAGTTSSFLMLGRTGMGVVQYSTSDVELRRALEEFSEDIRMAKAIKWTSASCVTLTVADNYTSTSNRVTYAWDSSTSGATARCFYRLPGDPTSAATRTVLVHDVSSFTFGRFNRLNAAAPSDAATKRVQVTFNVRKTGSTLVAATTSLVTASYILRNKVSN